MKKNSVPISSRLIIKIILTILSVLATAILFYLFYARVGYAILIFLGLFVGTAGYMFGALGGILAGILTLPFSYILLVSVVDAHLGDFWATAIPGSIGFILIGLLVGKLRDDEIKFIERETLSEKLRTMEVRFSQFMDNTPVIGWIKNPETWKYIYINKSFEDTFKIKFEVIKEKKDTDLWPKKIAEILKKNDIEVYSSGKVFRVYEDVPTPDGRMHHWLVYKFPIESEGKRLVAGTAIDITELIQLQDDLATRSTDLTNSKKSVLDLLEDEKALEQILKSERDRIQQIVSSMGEGLLVVDTQKRVTMLNPVAEELLELKGKVVMGKSWSELVKTLKGDQEVPLTERSFAQVVSEKKPIITNLEDNHYYLTHSGRKFPIVSITAPLISGGKLIGAVKVFRDATVDKEAKQNVERQVAVRTKELAEEKAKLLASIESLPRGFILTDITGKIILTNRLLPSIFGKLPVSGWTLSNLQKVLGKSFDVMGSFKKVVSGDTESVYMESVSWGSRFLEVYVVPVKLESGETVGTITLFGDVTEAKVLERSKDEFFSIASHELRTPLTAIRGNTALIKDYFIKKIKDPEFVGIVDDIHASSVRLIAIVNDFLNVGRLEQGRMEFKKEKVDVAAAIKQVFEELGPSADAKHLKLNVVLPEKKLPDVLGDEEKIREVLVNIIGNSINFSEKGSVTVIAEIKDNFLKVTISDTGRGIPEANKVLLFRKFQQAGTSLYTRDTTKGTGLGLYISKLMVEGMGGSIALAKSRVGEGSTFYFTLPLAKA